MQIRFHKDIIHARIFGQGTVHRNWIFFSEQTERDIVKKFDDPY